MSDFALFEDHFRASPYHDRYVQEFGDEALRRFADTQFPIWIDAHYPASGKKVLSEEETRYLGRLYANLAGAEPRDICLVLVTGERVGRWELPVADGLLTEDYWRETLDSVPRASRRMAS